MKKTFRNLVLSVAVFVMALMAFVAVVPAKATGRMYVAVSPSDAVKQFEVTKPAADTISYALIFRDINDYPAAAVELPSEERPFNNQSVIKWVLAARFSESPKATVRLKQNRKLVIVYRHGKYRLQFR